VRSLSGIYILISLFFHYIEYLFDLFDNYTARVFNDKKGKKKVGNSKIHLELLKRNSNRLFILPGKYFFKQWIIDIIEYSY
jgi:hypothetical protein